MKIPHLKIMYLMVLLLTIFSFFSCAKDSDLLSEAVFETSKTSAVEERTSNEESIETENGDWVTKTFAFPPISDAYVQEEDGFDQPIVRLQEDYRTSYLKFDLTAIQGNIIGAVLQFTIDSDDGDGTIMVGKALSNNWEEEDISENNAPTVDVTLGSISKSYEVGVTEKIPLNAEDLAPEITTIVLSHTSGNDLAFASKEHPEGIGPKLAVTYQVPAGTPDLEPMEEEVNENPTPTETPQPEATPPPNQESPMNQYPEPDYFVTVNGSGNNDGRTESSAWSIEHAFSMAVAGDVVYIKAGNYGNLQLEPENSGNAENPIKYIGYTNTPGDLVSNNGSTFSDNSNLDPNKMPLFSSFPTNNSTALTIFEPYIHIENFQITKYNTGVLAHDSATNFTAKNIIMVEMGTQNIDYVYDGWGMNIRSKNAVLENCFVLNSASEGFKLYDSDYSKVTYCSVYGTNPLNPTDYYFLVAGETNNALIENCHAERTVGLRHGGHGFNIKNDGTYNTFKNCTAIRTNFELTYVGVHHNTIDGGVIYGVDTTSSNWHAVMSIVGGAHDNLIKDLYIQDTWAAISLAIYDDRTGADASLGSDNTFENLTVKNTNRILNIGGGTNYSAKAKRYKFNNCSFTDFEFLAAVLYGGEDFEFTNSSFANGNYSITKVEGYEPYNTFSASWQNCTWSNINFTPPN